MMEQAQHNMGDVEILVNNAGIQHVAPVQYFEEEKWDDLISVCFSLYPLCWAGFNSPLGALQQHRCCEYAFVD